MSKTKENKLWLWIKSISFAILPFCIWLVFQALAWGGNQAIYTPGVNHPALPIDDVIPTVSWFIWFYYLTFPVGILAYFYCASTNRKQTYTIAVTLWIVTFISGLFYYFYPTEMIKPMDTYEIKNLSDKIMVRTWKTGNPNCCLPSGHCMMALGSFLCVATNKDVKWYVRVFVSFSAAMTFLATLFCRQHYILDCITTVVIMLPVYFILKAFKVGDKMEAKYCKKIFVGVPENNIQNEIDNTQQMEENAVVEETQIVEDDNTKNNVSDETQSSDNIDLIDKNE